jgi:4-amino-4-deoxy-L-arabinose transferase-like glycosyltransferase
MFGFERSGLAMFGFTWWFVAGGLAVLWLRRERAALLAVVCLLIPFFGFEFGFQSLKEGILISKNPNYLSLMTGPAMIISAYFFYRTFVFARTKFRAKSLAIFTLTILMLISMQLYGAYRQFVNGQNDAAPYIAVAAHLIKVPGATVYVHHFRWPLFLQYFLRYDSSYTFKDLNRINEEELNQLSNVYVVFNRRLRVSPLSRQEMVIFKVQKPAFVFLV